eukprot:141057_1
MYQICADEEQSKKITQTIFQQLIKNKYISTINTKKQTLLQYIKENQNDQNPKNIIARYSEDGCWYSAQIIKYKCNEIKYYRNINCTVNITYIGYNNTEWIDILDIKLPTNWIDKTYTHIITRNNIELSLFLGNLCHQKVIDFYIRKYSTNLAIRIPNEIKSIILLFYAMPLEFNTKMWLMGIKQTDNKRNKKAILCEWNEIPNINDIITGYKFIIFSTSNSEIYITGIHVKNEPNKTYKQCIYFKEHKMKINKICTSYTRNGVYWITQQGELYFNNIENSRRQIYGNIYSNFHLGSTGSDRPVIINYFISNNLKVIDAACSTDYAIIVCSNNEVYWIGGGNINIYGKYKKLEDMSNKHIIRVEMGESHILLLSLDGSVYCNMFESYESYGEHFKFVKIKYFEQNGIQISEIKIGFDFCLVIDRYGKCFSFGNNLYAQCGNGTDGNIVNTPYLMETLKRNRIIYIDCGAYHACAINDNGHCFLWGKNDVNQCFPGKVIDYRLKAINVVSPVKINQLIPNNLQICGISLGYDITYILTFDDL